MSEQTHPGGAPGTTPVEAAQLVSPAPTTPIADEVEKQLDSKVVLTWRIGSAIAAAFLSFMSLIAVIILMFAAPFSMWILFLLPLGWLVLSAALACWAFFWPAVRYRHVFYRVSSNGIEIKRGVFWRTVIQVPKSRVQHTDVSRGPIERVFDLATLIIYTAGTEHASISLGGLNDSTAFAIRDHLIPGGGDDAV